MTTQTTTRPARRRPAPLHATVTRATLLTPHLVRVTVTGPDLQRFRWPGPAGHLKLMLPPPGAGDVALPEPDSDGLVAFDRSHATSMRTYTARHFDPATLELDLDVVLHGDGLASSWARDAAPGDRLAVSVPRAAGFLEDADADWVLLAGDASALPALATIVPTLSRPATVLVELPEPADRLDLGFPAEWLTVQGQPGAALEERIAGFRLPPGRGQVWVAGEAGSIRRIRARLLADLGRDQLTTRGYWRSGESNHPDHDYGETE